MLLEVASFYDQLTALNLLQLSHVLYFDMGFIFLLCSQDLMLTKVLKIKAITGFFFHICGEAKLAT
jgi:hypothetical protein